MGHQVEYNSERRRFETQLDGRVAFLSYRFENDSVFFDHTFVPAEFRGRRVAEALVRAGLEEARRRQWKIVPECSYVAAFIDRHPEFADLAT